MRRFFSCLVVSLLTVGTAFAVAPAPTPGVAAEASPTTQEQKSKLTKAERAHVREIVRAGKADGLTKAQIKAKVDAYLKSIGKHPRKHTEKPKGGVAS